MDEVVNAVQLALADQDCFDEMLQYSCTNNFVTYSDSTGDYASQVVDGEFWAPDGAGRATTITFNPNVKTDGTTFWYLEDAIVNDMTYGNGSATPNRTIEGALIENNQCYFKNASLNGNQTGYTYNRVRQTIGDSVVSTSQTYRNSSFTVFIKFNQKDGVTVADVYGQFNGTNLDGASEAAKGSGTTEYDNNGDAIISITTPGTQKAEYDSSALNGSGSFGVSIDYKQNNNNYNSADYTKQGFYTSIYTAATDLNNNTIGANSDCEEKDATIGIYVDFNNNYTIVVLKDFSIGAEKVVIEKSCKFDVNGKTIIMNDVGYIKFNKATTFDASKKGSTLVGASRPRLITFMEYSTVIGGIFSSKIDQYQFNDTDSVIYFENGGNISESKITIVINVKPPQNNQIGIASAAGTLTINNIDISISYNVASPASITGVLSTNDNLYIYNSKIKVNVNGDCGIGSPIEGVRLFNKNTTIKNCDIHGYRGGVKIECQNALIDGGVYSSDTYGGIWTHGSNNTTYVQNATLLANGNLSYSCPVLLGGNETINNKLYINNCKINTNTGYSITIARDDIEDENKNNSLYISNTHFSSIKYIRMEYEACSVYIGTGCNITIDNTQRPNRVTQTNEMYKK